MKHTVLKSSNSPHLALVLEQLACSGELDEPTAKKILVSFETAVSKNGNLEIGYTRIEGQSFNPRAARILLILLKDAKITDEKFLQLAAQLAGQGEEYQAYLELEEPIVVSAAFLLDRLRHLHLERSADNEKIYSACLKVKELLSSEFPTLSLLLDKGVERMKRNIS